jgi:hypothetical protein
VLPKGLRRLEPGHTTWTRFDFGYEGVKKRSLLGMWAILLRQSLRRRQLILTPARQLDGNRLTVGLVTTRVRMGLSGRWFNRYRFADAVHLLTRALRFLSETAVHGYRTNDYLSGRLASIGFTLKTSPIEQGMQLPPFHPGLSSEAGLVVLLVCDRIVLLIR